MVEVKKGETLSNERKFDLSEEEEEEEEEESESELHYSAPGKRRKK